MTSSAPMLTPMLAVVLLSGLVPGAASGEIRNSPKCADGEHRRLDFWLGDWDAFEAGGGDKPVARARIEVMLDGCALRETYEQTDGLSGESFTTYDPARKVWHQSRVTNRGQLLTMEGRFQGNSLTLLGTRLSAEGREERVRGVWTPQDGGVRKIAHTSADGGATWRPLFDVLFRRHKGESAAAGPGASSGDDAKTVAALDTEYQAAVKANDAAVMDRILADDFVLITGRGKTYNKAELLTSARNKSTVYEHQEELEQKVRVWGDTAVVTALLWMKGSDGGSAFDRRLWFSDTYVRTPAGWRYALGQASLPLPGPP